MEAMACGLPTVGTSVGGMAEIIEDGHSGHVIAPDDVGGLAEAVRSLALDSRRRVGMGLAGRARAENVFNAARNYPAILSLLKRCADNGRSLGRIPAQEAIIEQNIEKPAA